MTVFVTLDHTISGSYFILFHLLHPALCLKGAATVLPARPAKE